MKSRSSQTSFSIRIISALLLIFAASLVIYKTHFVTINGHYIAIGFDNIRVLGRSQFLRYNGYLDAQFDNRYGLSLFVNLIAWMFDLPPSQTLLLPHWIINLGAPALLYLISYRLSQTKLHAAISVFLYSILINLPLNVNDSHFLTFLVFPLHLFLLYQKPKLPLTKLAHTTTTFAINLFSLFTHLPLTLVIFGILNFLTFIQTNSLPKTIKPLLIQFTSLLGFATITYFLYPDLQTQTLTSSFLDFYFYKSLTRNPTYQALTIFFTITLFSVIIFRQKITHLIHHLFKRHKNLKPTAQTIVLLLLPINIINLLASEFANLTPIQIPFFPQIDLTHQAMLTLGLFGVISSTNPKNINLKHLQTFITFFILAIFFSQPSFIYLVIANKRPLHIFSYFLLLLIPYWVRTSARSKLILAAIILIGAPSLHLANFTSKHHRLANTSIQQIADWFVTLPDHTSVMFIATHLKLPTIAHFEFPQAYYYISSSVPPQHILSQNRCPKARTECASQIVKYSQKHHLKYIIVENATDDIINQVGLSARLIGQNKNTYVFKL